MSPSDRLASRSNVATITALVAGTAISGWWLLTRFLVKVISDSLIKPFQAPVFDDPSRYGLKYDSVVFHAEDGTRLSGWLIKANETKTKKPPKVIIQSHFGVAACRSGYTPKGKGMGSPKKEACFLRQAKYLSEAGYHVLMYDLRGHGNSGVGPSGWITWGVEEGQDVVAAVDFVAKCPETKNADIGLLSICMGSSCANMAFASGKLNKFPIKAQVMVQPHNYPDFIDRLGLPGWLRRRIAAELKKRTGGIDYEKEATSLPCVKDVYVPTIVLQNTNDTLQSEAYVKSTYDALPSPDKELRLIPLEKRKTMMENRFEMYDWIGTEAGKEQVLGWFDKHM